MSTDLTSERLDELAGFYTYLLPPTAKLSPDPDDASVAEQLTLIDMAKRAQSAERERDALREAMGTIAKHAMEEHSCGDPDVVAALALPTDAPHTNDAAPGITMSRAEQLWGASFDWGHCDGNGVGVRWCADLGNWLPVCAKHLTGPHGDAQPTDAGGEA